jgi:hypothetical protein
MPILLQHPDHSTLAQRAEFVDEAELEAILSNSPQLLMKPSDPAVVRVANQIDLPESGLLDILLVNSNGLPIAVEAKLARNGQSRREIVAQVIDYVSCLTELTVDELDNLVDGSLERALRSFDSTPDNVAFERRWQAVAANLRAGLARVVLALDEAPPELQRMARFLAENSNLDMQLVTVSKFADQPGGTVYTPQFLLDGPQRALARASNVIREPKPELQAAVTAYDRTAVAGLATRGKSADWRAIRPSNWPSSVHYEFIQGRDYIATDIHLEGDRVLVLQPVLRNLAGRHIGPQNTELQWDPRWSANRGRLQARFSIETSAEVLAATMTAMIQLTRPLIDKALATIQ